MVIAIIGILSSIVLVNLAAARKNAKDAAIMAEANSMMKAIQTQVETSSAPNYVPYSSHWIPNTNNCNFFSNLPGGASLTATCNKVLEDIGTTGFKVAAPYESNYKLFCFYHSDGITSKFTVMAALPGAQKFYCIGSNGHSSKSMNLDGSGCGAAWTCPGCYSDLSN
jgi:type II secretory pathway pseudopilin PulG